MPILNKVVDRLKHVVYKVKMFRKKYIVEFPKVDDDTLAAILSYVDKKVDVAIKAAAKGAVEVAADKYLNEGR